MTVAVRHKLLFVLIAFIGALTYCTVDKATEDNPTTSYFYLNHHDSVDYVGIDECAKCHGDVHQTFIHTGMGSSFDSATQTKSAAHFHNTQPIYDAHLDFYYFPFWQNNKLYIKEYRLNEKGDTLFQRAQQIDFIVGSGQHTNSHLFLDNGFVRQAPLTWYAQKEKWDLPPGFENGNNSRFNRIIDVECMSCHNALPTMQPNSTQKFAQIGRGIDCERCHGPGELHVNVRMNGGEINGPEGRDRTIVHPGKLAWDRQIDICQRCHLQGLNLLQPGKSFMDFKPGMDLSEIFEIYLPKYQGENQQMDMANHSARLQQSACFIQTAKNEEQLTCITCHNPHVSVKETQNLQFNSACKNCHNSQVHPPQPKFNNCVQCHMPQKGAEDIPHVSVHDHKIQIPGQQDTAQKIRKLMGLYAVNNPNPSPINQLKAYLNYYEKFDPNPLFLQKAKELIDKGIGDVVSQVHYYYLTLNYTQLLQLINQNDAEEIEDAWTLYRLGKAAWNRQEWGVAQPFLRKACLKAPDNLRFIEQYGQLMVEANQTQAACEWWLKHQNTSTQSDIIFANNAACLLEGGNRNEAKLWAEKALKLNPDNILANNVLFLLYQSIGQEEKAKVYKSKLKLND